MPTGPKAGSEKKGEPRSARPRFATEGTDVWRRNVRAVVGPLIHIH